MVIKKVSELLRVREFISVATSDSKGMPNAAPKFVLKLENNFIYLVDYVIGRTWENVKVNPRISLSFMDTDTLVGYQINGPVEIIDSGPEYDKILKELLQKKIDLSTKRIIEGVETGKVHGSFEVAIPDKIVILKVRLEEIVEIGTSGELKRQRLCET
jgi:predicted pyridoxine 5'-phosphate oxidase superfamily flavin-nucleotide-binding protein